MFTTLENLLRRRIEIIADHAWRDRDAVSHLQALQDVSEEITAWTAQNRIALDPQLRHFLANSSYQKALAHVQNLIPHNEPDAPA